MSAPLSSLDDHSRSQIENYVQQSLGLLQDRLQQSEVRLAQSEAAAPRTQPRDSTVAGDGRRSSRRHAAPSSPHEDLIRRDDVPIPQLAHRHRRRLMTDCAALPPRQRWIFVQDSLADPIQKRLAHYFESGEARGWDANAFVDYLDTLYADNTTIAVARLELHQLRKRFCWSLSELAQLQPGDRFRSVVGVKGIEVVTEPFTELVQLQPGASGWDPRDCPGQKSSVGGGKGRRSRSSACLR
ncbi:hypothetical protein E4U34_008246 [Claviceps purpurea]|nr:hypothetical protein E4U34_008246 [Claviceps purpurea]